MVHNRVYIPLGKKLNAGSFWENHPKHGVCLFQPAFLSALHGATIINAGTLYSTHTSFQCDRISEFRAPVCQDIFEYRSEFIGSHAFFQTVKTKAYRAFCTTDHKECKEKLLLCKNRVNRVFFDFLEEWTVSISTCEGSARLQKSLYNLFVKTAQSVICVL